MSTDGSDEGATSAPSVADATRSPPELKTQKQQDLAYAALFEQLAKDGLTFVSNADVADLLKRCKGLSTGDVRAIKFKAQRFFKNHLATPTNRGLGHTSFALLMKTIACAQHPDERWGLSIGTIDMKAIADMLLPMVEIDDEAITDLLHEASGTNASPRAKAALKRLRANSAAAAADTAAAASVTASAASAVETGRGAGASANVGGNAAEEGGSSSFAKGAAAKPPAAPVDYSKMDRNPFQSARNSELEVCRSYFRALAHVVLVPAPVADRFGLPRTLALVGARSVAELLKTASGGIHTLTLRSIFTATAAVFGCSGAWLQWPVFVTMLRMVAYAQMLLSSTEKGAALSRRQFTPTDVLASMHDGNLNTPQFTCNVDQLFPMEDAPELDMAKAMAALQQDRERAASVNAGRNGGGSGGGGNTQRGGGDDFSDDSSDETSGERKAGEAWDMYKQVQESAAANGSSSSGGAAAKSSSNNLELLELQARQHVQHLSAEESRRYTALFNGAPSLRKDPRTGDYVVGAGDVAAVLRNARLVSAQHLRLVFGTVASMFASDGRTFSFAMFVVVVRMTVSSDRSMG
jgi:hypothetical protein